MSRAVYRYDPAEFKHGELIAARGDHLSRRAVEMALRNFSPRMADIRSKSLYVWRDRLQPSFYGGTQ